MAERIYSPDEVAAIIERTAERQSRASSADRTEGLTLAEIEHACREAGLDPELARQSAAELDAGGPVVDRGSGATSTAEYWVDGVPTPEGLEDAVDRLRARFGPSSSIGTAESGRSVGAGWEWTHQSMSGHRRTVRVSPREGRTRIRVTGVDAGFSDDRAAGAMAGALVGGVASVLLGGLLMEGFGLSDPVALAVCVAALLSAIVLGGLFLPPLIRRGRERDARENRQLAQEVAQWVTAGASPSAVPEAQAVGDAIPAAPPRLDPGLLDAEPTDEPSGADARRTRS